MRLTTLECRLRLARAALPGVEKARIAHRLAARAGSTGDPYELIRDAGLNPAAADRLLDGSLAADVARARDWLDAGGELVALGDPAYPPLLAQIPDPPVVLFVRGVAGALLRPQIAVVGSRNPSRAGVDTAFDFAAALVATGFSISSGLARGIDSAAHDGALDGDGSTVAVMGNGPDRTYPARNRALADRICAAGGAVVTEFFPGDPPRPGHFPRRNRIISGLSLGTLVVEAAVRSGSLITARCALEQGREVFAIPGSIHQPSSRGCHRLIRQGAKLVERVADVVEEFEWLAAPELPRAGPVAGIDETAGLDDDLHRLYDCIGFDPADIDTIASRADREASGILGDLLMLELRGLVCKSAGFFTRRVPVSRS